MSDTSLPISEYIKQGVFLIIIVAIALFGIKSCRKFQKKRQVIIELSSLAGESAAYEQFYTETAHENLLKAMYQMHLATELGLAPNETIDKVMQKKETFFASEEVDEFPIKKSLIREALLSNYDNCIKLGIFDNESNIDELSAGEFPTITQGPAANKQAVIRPIIPSLVLPGADKLLPNMMISPPRLHKIKHTETLFERARAKLLVEDLANAGIIDREDYKKVIEHYKKPKPPKK